MPQVVVPLLIPLLTTIGVSGAVATFAANVIAYGAFIGASYLATTLLTAGPGRRDTPPIPKPEDGRYNLKQSVPSPWTRLGRSQSGGHYLALLEYQGVAYHVLCVSPSGARGQ